MKRKTGMKQMVKAEQAVDKVAGVVLSFNGGDRENKEERTLPRANTAILPNIKLSIAQGM
jgi:hypothetical protein